MKIYVFPPSGRIVGIIALKNYLALDCELKPIDLGRGDQGAPEYESLNRNRKMPTLEDDSIVLWESNAILFYMASKRPESGVWPSDVKGQSSSRLEQPSRKNCGGDPGASSRKVQSLQANAVFYGTELHPTSSCDRAVVQPDRARLGA